MPASPRLSSHRRLAPFAVAASLLVPLVGCDPFTAQEQARLEAARARQAEQEANVARIAANSAAKQSAESAKPTVAAPSAPEPLVGDLTPELVEAGWIALFDGRTLFGWNPTSKADWKVRDGVIEVSQGEPGLLCTTTQFADYELRLEFRFAKGANSGVFLHSPLRPVDPSADCYELNIAEPDVSPFPTGSFVKRKKAEAEAAPDVWHAFDVVVQGARQTVKLNGRVVLEYEDPAPLARGFIGLQLNQGAVAFKNIRLRPLSLQNLFNGKNLDGWVAPPQQDARFSVGPGELLHVQGGRGQLESQTRYADFTLQLACRTNAPALNSGLFFRCIPGETMNGYESQIHNGCIDGDRDRPVDCGTGGVFRRQNARRVVADDQAWFWKTLVVDGPHVSVWVNGFQVTDWTDRRPVDDNPRKGLRTAAGSLMLQGHDPTTDIDFRDLRAAEMAPRRAPAVTPPAPSP